MRDTGREDGATIYAPATAPGKAGIAVVRISGPQADAVLRALARRSTPARQATLVHLRDADGGLIDVALALRFEAGASFTAEEVVELQCHGGPAIVDAVLRAVAATGLAHLAQPGEFTRRALENGAIDLMGVHAVADAIEAETELQRQFAMRRLAGEDRGIAKRWRRTLIHASSYLNAAIDFADEELPHDIVDRVRETLTGLRADFATHRDGYAAASSLRHGFTVAVIGPPNSGKSSLINVVAKRDVSIVTDRAGTTRDIIEARIDLGGLPVTFIDTAGLRDGEDEIERLGVERARTRAAEADLRVLLRSDDQQDAGREMIVDGDISIRSKIDLFGGEGVSARTNEGVDDLLRVVHTTLSSRATMAGAIVRSYEAELVSDAISYVDRALDQLSYGAGAEVVAEELTGATMALQQMVGEIGVENVLDEIFSSFCLGK